MKLKSLAKVLRSPRGAIQMGVLYNRTLNKDIATGSVEYLVQTYGPLEVEQVQADGDKIVITVK